jgi:cytochrome c553
MRVTAGWVSVGAIAIVGLAGTFTPAPVAMRAMPSTPANGDTVVPAWLFPIAPAPAAPPVFDSVTPRHLPRVRAAFVESKLHGRKPALFACAYCHGPDGAGRPENVPLAGLPAAYIVQQVADMKSGARGSAWHGAPWVPYDNMKKVAAAATDEDVAVAAQYYTHLAPRPRTRVVEARIIPRVLPSTGIFLIQRGSGTESLGNRLIEAPMDIERHDLRDPYVGYVAYVPTGSIARGRAITTRPVNAAKQVCGSCHGPALRGLGVIPPIAGRSPGYLVRQLLAFKTGARATPASAPMQVVAGALSLDDMIAVSAYAATLKP